MSKAILISIIALLLGEEDFDLVQYYYDSNLTKGRPDFWTQKNYNKFTGVQTATIDVEQRKISENTIEYRVLDGSTSKLITTDVISATAIVTTPNVGFKVNYPRFRKLGEEYSYAASAIQNSTCAVVEHLAQFNIARETPPFDDLAIGVFQDVIHRHCDSTVMVDGQSKDASYDQYFSKGIGIILQSTRQRYLIPQR